MKRIYLLFVAVVCAAGMSAQMRVWANGQKLFEMNLSAIDSITFVKPGDSDTVPPVNPDTTVIPHDTTATSAFDYDHWRNQTKIAIYGMTDPISLPWAPVSVTSIPDEYKHPEREMRIDSITPRWQLAFNLCDDDSLPGINMFGLWDELSMTMRIYAYIEELPNQNAHSCFLEAVSSVPVFVEGDSKCWMPAQSTIETCTWSNPMSDTALTQPSTTRCQLLPITGSLNGEVNPGWICFELPLTTGLFTVSKNANISFSLYGVETISFTGNMDISGTLQSYNGKITVPGSKLKLAGGLVGGTGDIVKSIADGVKGIGDGSGITAVAGMFGGIGHGVGKIVSGVADGKDKNYQVDLDFNISAEAEINGSLNSTLGTSVKSVQLDYSALFENILAHSHNPNADSLTTSIWNLKEQPVFYICDNVFITIDESFNGQFKFVRAGFLDPSSIEIVLNNDSLLFPSNQINKITVLAYDFIFVGSNYSLDAQPYYDFYGIRQDGFNSNERIVTNKPYAHFTDFHNFMLDTISNYQTVGRNMLTYYGVMSSYDNTYGMDTYNYMISPAIVGNTVACPNNFSEIGVSVVVEMEFNNGDKRLFTERFLPQIRGFKGGDKQTMQTQLQSATPQSSVNGIPVTYPLFEVEQRKCLRMLDWIHY